MERLAIKDSIYFEIYAAFRVTQEADKTHGEWKSH